MQPAEPRAAAHVSEESELPSPGPGYQPRQLLLLGSGHAHVQVLQALAARPLVGVRVVLVAPHPRQVYSAMVPGFVAGHYPLDDCTIALEPLVRRAGVRWLQRSVRHLDANHRAVLLDDGSRLQYDWLSINTGPVQNREQIERDMPGAREHGLFVRPIEGFASLWPQVADMGAKRPMRVTVVGGGTSGFELACAVRHRFANAAVTLVAGPSAFGHSYLPSVQHRMVQTLKARNITVLQDVATAIKADEVRLGCGAGLACDVTILSTGAQAPLWLAGSGLQLDAKGLVSVNAFQQSVSHPAVFAVGDICSRADQPDRPSARGTHTVHVGPVLAHNLSCTTSGGPLRAYAPASNALNLISCGNRYAIASWGNSSAEGRWVWWLKNWIDRRFIARYSPG